MFWTEIRNKYENRCASAVVYSLFVVSPLLVGFNVRYLLCLTVLCVLSSFVIISLEKRELNALLLLCFQSIFLTSNCTMLHEWSCLIEFIKRVEERRSNARLVGHYISFSQIV